MKHSCFSPAAVFFPTTPGTYAPVLFVPGVFTLVATELYSTVLAHFASYGYIVFGVDLFWPLAGEAGWRKWSQEFVPEEHEYEKMFDVINWVCHALVSKKDNMLIKHAYIKLGACVTI